jgi:hypothetical protein
MPPKLWDTSGLRIRRIGRGAFRDRHKLDREDQSRVTEEIMLALVAKKRVKNPFAESLRFPGEG